ncbi:MAG TPA: hypothetical protein VFM46_04770, partial [Pseudomonadales bacterium]|nr:hypothetical protein [Pseudomonadales bacterium]
MGFSQSFLNESIFSIYARNFGQPEPAAISFGLSAAWPAALLIRLGLHASDAYASVAAIWFSVAFISAYKLCKLNNVPTSNAILGSVVWMSMPIIWQHSGYSMLSFGIALLPFYFLALIYLLTDTAQKQSGKYRQAAFTWTAAVISVFMDGYSFMMFASGGAIYLAYHFYIHRTQRSRIIFFCVPVFLFSIASAYFLYTRYIGKTGFDQAPIDFFRGWGADIAYFILPSNGVLWLFDTLDLSVARTSREQFGDSSVWTTTFCLPILILALASWWRLRKNTPMATGALLLVLLGLYLSLGPSIKFFSIKPMELQLQDAQQHISMMPPEYAIGPTGSEWVFRYLPGFKVMRASYRWAALGIFGCWLLVMIAAGRLKKGRSIIASIALVVLVLFNMPDLNKKWDYYTQNRELFFDIDEEALTELSKALHPKERVTFLPYRNDFLINYLAPRLDIQTYNIGGDKNLASAERNWPSSVRQFDMGVISHNQAEEMALILLNNDSDVIVVPYFDTLWGAHMWPCAAESGVPIETRNNSESHPGCPSYLRKTLAPVIKRLQELEYLVVEDNYLYATVRTKPGISKRET